MYSTFKTTLLRKLALALALTLTLSIGTVTALAMTPKEEEEAIKRMEEWASNLRLAPGSQLPSGNGETTSKSSTSKPTTDDLNAYAQKVFELVNNEREKAGLNPVVWDADLGVCANIRAKELSIKYSHERPGSPDDYSGDWPNNVDGKGVYNASSVADEQGVDHGWIMENGAVQNLTPESVMNAWMNSEGHRRNILKTSHTRCGVGIYYTEKIGLSGYNWHWIIWFDNY